MTTKDILKAAEYVLDHWETIALIGSLAWGWAQRKWQITGKAKWALTALKSCGVTVQSLHVKIGEVASMADRTNEEKFKIISEWLQEAAHCAGIELTDNTCDLIVQWAYSTWKARNKK